MRLSTRRAWACASSANACVSRGAMHAYLTKNDDSKGKARGRGEKKRGQRTPDYRGLTSQVPHFSVLFGQPWPTWRLRPPPTPPPSRRIPRRQPTRLRRSSRTADAGYRVAPWNAGLLPRSPRTTRSHRVRTATRRRAQPRLLWRRRWNWNQQTAATFRACRSACRAAAETTASPAAPACGERSLTNAPYSPYSQPSCSPRL